MASRLTVRLPNDLKKEVDELARELNRSQSDIVRAALRDFLMSQPGSDIRLADRGRSLIGSLESGIPDLAERDCEYILESLRNARLALVGRWRSCVLILTTDRRDFDVYESQVVNLSGLSRGATQF